jgi:XTP/dITP diphosphohydrolase
VSRRIVLASSSAAKLREISMMLHGLAWEIVPQGQLGVDATDEPHPTFVENALAKARHASACTGMPALADDSGLCVDALNGAPGVFSARFAGDGASDQNNNVELLRRLAGVTQRQAHYTCVLVAVRTAEDAEPLVVDARWYGEIAQAPRGEGGFGYDPLFYVADLGVTAAELDPAHKNRISHRGLALNALAERLADWR